MNAIHELMEQHDWNVTIEVDPNTGGDGPRVRFNADASSFRKFAALLTAMADTVDNPDHPASDIGWQLGFNPDDHPQLSLKNAAILTLNCLPNDANSA